MAKLSRDLGAGTLHPRENIHATGTLAAANAEVIVDADGASTVAVDLRGTFVGTVAVEGTVDGTNWLLIPVRPIAGVAFSAGLATAGSWIAAAAGFDRVRARMTAYTSGAATATLVASTGILDQALTGTVTPLIVTATAAAAAGVTLTLPAPGAGLRQYITYIGVTRFAAAALTAAAAPVNITTSNIPGSLIIAFAADALTLGQVDRWREDLAFPIASSAQNTATTLIAPATTGVIWRLTAGYYVAP